MILVRDRNGVETLFEDAIGYNFDGKYLHVFDAADEELATFDGFVCAFHMKSMDAIFYENKGED